MIKSLHHAQITVPRGAEDAAVPRSVGEVEATHNKKLKFVQYT